MELYIFLSMQGKMLSHFRECKHLLSVQFWLHVLQTGVFIMNSKFLWSETFTCQYSNFLFGALISDFSSDYKALEQNKYADLYIQPQSDIADCKTAQRNS